MAEMKPVGIDQTTGQQRPVSDGDTVNVGSKIKIKIVRTGDYSAQPNQVLQLYDWDASPDLLSEPASQITSFTAGIAWSPNGEFLMRTTGSDTNLYQRTGNTFNLLTSPASMPSNPQQMDWSADSELLAVPGSGPIYLSVYQRDGTTFTRLSDPNTLPSSGTSYATAFSPSGEFLALTGALASENWFVYRRNGTSFSVIPAPSSLPDSATTDVAWSPDGRFLCFTASTGTRRVYIYERTGIDDFTLLDEPSSGAIPGLADGVTWSSNGRFLAVSSQGQVGIANKFFSIFERSDNTFFEVSSTSNPSSLNPTTGGGKRIPWSSDDKYFAVPLFQAPWFSVYERNDTTFTLLSDPASTPSSGVLPLMEWSPDNQFLAVGQRGSSVIFMYQTSVAPPSSGIVEINGYTN